MKNEGFLVRRALRGGGGFGEIAGLCLRKVADWGLGGGRGHGMAALGAFVRAGPQVIAALVTTPHHVASSHAPHVQ